MRAWGVVTAALCTVSAVLALVGITLGPNRWWLNALFALSLIVVMPVYHRVVTEGFPLLD